MFKKYLGAGELRRVNSAFCISALRPLSQIRDALTMAKSISGLTKGNCEITLATRRAKRAGIDGVGFVKRSWSRNSTRIDLSALKQVEEEPHESIHHREVKLINLIGH